MIEFKVRPVCRYSVTRFEQTENSGSCGQVGEFPNMKTAQAVADAMAKTEGGTVVSNILPDLDIPAMLRNIATESEAASIMRGAVVLEAADGSVEVYGLGPAVGVPEELFEKGLARYQSISQLESPLE